MKYKTTNEAFITQYRQRLKAGIKDRIHVINSQPLTNATIINNINLCNFSKYIYIKRHYTSHGCGHGNILSASC